MDRHLFADVEKKKLWSSISGAFEIHKKRSKVLQIVRKACVDPVEGMGTAPSVLSADSSVKAPGWIEMEKLWMFDKFLPEKKIFQYRCARQMECVECVYCGQFRARKNMTRDHVKPRSKGFKLCEVTNTAVACMECNQRKRDRDLGEWMLDEFVHAPAVYAFYRPRIQRFLDANPLITSTDWKSVVLDHLPLLL